MITTEANATTTTSKRCSRCFEVRPLGEFRRQFRNRDVRRAECRACYNQQQREFREGKKQALLSRRLTEINREPDAKRVVAAFDELIRRLGGIDEFARVYVAAYRNAAATKPGSQIEARYLAGITGMFLAISQADQQPAVEPAVEPMEPEVPVVETLDDDGLIRQVVEYELAVMPERNLRRLLRKRGLDVQRAFP